MLRSLELRNFRGFEQHQIEFRQLTVAVGRNNAGKSTIVEALRLVALASARHRTSAYRLAPPSIDAPLGVQPAIDELQIEPTGLFYRYGSPPSIIRAEFSAGQIMELFLLSENRLHSVLRYPGRHPIRSSSEAQQVGLANISILPQVAPVAPVEDKLTPDYVRRMVSTRLAPQHFRNQLSVFHNRFDDFRQIVEEGWPGLRVDHLDVPTHLETGPLRLTVRNLDFVAEVATMGHGVQMWLQVMWFLARARGSECLILDEPDVYMHPDLQRRLIRLLRNQTSQVILTSHSPEIMAEVEPSEILVIDRSMARSMFADSLPAVQRVLDAVGSTQNIQLTRLFRAGRFLIVEGDDVEILKHLHSTLFPDTLAPLDTIPNLEVGGWSGWPWAWGSAMTMQNATGDTIRVYCILDSDYHPPEEIEERNQAATQLGINLHIWHHKELENYLLVPSAIARVIAARTREASSPSEELIRAEMSGISRQLQEGARDNLAAELFARSRQAGLQAANRRAREIFTQRIDEIGELGVVSGKAIISQLSKWSQDNWGTSFGPTSLAREIRSAEIFSEMRGILSAIEQGRTLPF